MIFIVKHIIITGYQLMSIVVSRVEEMNERTKMKWKKYKLRLKKKNIINCTRITQYSDFISRQKNHIQYIIIINQMVKLFALFTTVRSDRTRLFTSQTRNQNYRLKKTINSFQLKWTKWTKWSVDSRILHRYLVFIKASHIFAWLWTFWDWLEHCLRHFTVTFIPSD